MEIHIAPENSEEFQGVAWYSQSKYGMSAIGSMGEFTLLKAPHFEHHDRRSATLDPDYPHSPVVDQGFHHIPWAIEFFDAFCSPIDIIHHAYEYNIPILAMGSNSFHGQVSFIQLDASNVILSSIKEIEADLQDAPQVFYKLNLNEYGIIFRFIEYGGYTTSCHVAINSAILCKEAIEVDLLERIVDNGIQFSDVQLSENQLSFTINPYEIKSILLIAHHE